MSDAEPTLGKRRCSIDGCPRPHKAHGWCRTHYARWQRHGDPLGPRAQYPDLPDEHWLPVVGWEGLYEVSDLGRVRGLYTSRIRKPVQDPNDLRLRINLLRDAKRTTVYVHRLVLEAFVGPRPEGQLCRHGPGGRLDNRLVNLCWGTPRDNNLDQRRDGTETFGEDHPWAKLTEAQVREIRQRYAAGGVSQQALGDEYGMSQTGIGLIVRGVNWSEGGD